MEKTTSPFAKHRVLRAFRLLSDWAASDILAKASSSKPILLFSLTGYDLSQKFARLRLRSDVPTGLAGMPHHALSTTVMLTLKNIGAHDPMMMACYHLGLGSTFYTYRREMQAID